MSSPEQPKPNLFKRILGIAGVIVGSQMVGPQHSTAEQTSQKPDNTKTERMVIKYPVIQGQVLLRKKDGRMVPYEKMVIALQKQDENDPQAGPTSGGAYRHPAYFTVATTTADEEGRYTFEEVEPGRYIIGEGKDDALRNRTNNELGGFDTWKPTTITSESKMELRGITIFDEERPPLTPSTSGGVVVKD